VETNCFFIKEKLDDGIVRINLVNLGGLADCLTKGLGVKECGSSYDKMGMLHISSILRGCVGLCV
jgi:hypothetical protein